MSDSGRDSGKPARHPVSVAFDQFGDAHLSLFQGSAEGRYLANRLQEAFREGWLACERLVKDALDGRDR